MKRKNKIISLATVAVLAAIALAAYIWIQIKPDTAEGYAARYAFCAALGVKAKMPTDTSSLKETYAVALEYRKDLISKTEVDALKFLRTLKDDEARKIAARVKAGEVEVKIKISDSKPIGKSYFFNSVYKAEISGLNGIKGTFSKEKRPLVEKLQREIDMSMDPYYALYKSKKKVNRSLLRYGRLTSSVKYRSDAIKASKEYKEAENQNREFIQTMMNEKSRYRKTLPLYEKPIFRDEGIGNLYCLDVFEKESGKRQTVWLVDMKFIWRPKYVKKQRLPDFQTDGIFFFRSDAEKFMMDVFERDLRWHMLNL